MEGEAEMNNEEKNEMANRIWDILCETPTPSDSISLLVGLLAAFAIQHSRNPKDLSVNKKEIFRMLEDSWERNSYNLEEKQK